MSVLKFMLCVILFFTISYCSVEFVSAQKNQTSYKNPNCMGVYNESSELLL
jgi:hypothetical protein